MHLSGILDLSPEWEPGPQSDVHLSLESWISPLTGNLALSLLYLPSTCSSPGSPPCIYPLLDLYPENLLSVIILPSQSAPQSTLLLTSSLSPLGAPARHRPGVHVHLLPAARIPDHRIHNLHHVGHWLGVCGADLWPQQVEAVCEVRMGHAAYGACGASLTRHSIHYQMWTRFSFDAALRGLSSIYYTV